MISELKFKDEFSHSSLDWTARKVGEFLEIKIEKHIDTKPNEIIFHDELMLNADMVRNLRYIFDNFFPRIDA